MLVYLSSRHAKISKSLFSDIFKRSWYLEFAANGICCYWVCVCACVYGLTILMLLGEASRLTRVFLAYATTSPDRVASDSKDPWWYPNTRCLTVKKVGQSQSQWRRSCSSWQQFRQVGSCEGSSRWRYCLREGWWPDRKGTIRMSSFLPLICFASQETLWCLHTEATRSCIGGASRIVSLMTWMIEK